MNIFELVILSAVSGSAASIWWTFTWAAFKVARPLLATAYLVMVIATVVSFVVLFMRLIGLPIQLAQFVSTWILVVLIGLPPVIELGRAPK